jgi:hypothetical protein
MNTEEPIKAALEASRIITRAENMARGQCTLGELIALLKSRPQDQDVVFDFCGCEPREPQSYRGYYEQLSLGWRARSYENKTPDVATVLTWLEGAIGKVYEGYKGGDFRMHADTPLWVANQGESDGTAIVGLADCDYQAIIATLYIP